MLKYILPILVLVTSCFGIDQEAVNKYLNQLNKLTKQQRDILVKTYNYGKEFNLQYILPTLAWKESNFGLWMLNIHDGEYGSYGIYHIRLDYALTRNKILNKWDSSRYAEKLLYDFNVSSSEAVSLVVYWLDYYKSTEDPIYYMFTSYNGGYRPAKQAYEYGRDSLNRLEAIKLYFTNKQ